MPLGPPRTPPECDSEKVSHNLAGQRLGRKGMETRERILAAVGRLLEDPLRPPVTLTSVAREAAVRLPNLYLYFPDFGALLSAALDRVMESADEAFVNLLRAPWPDDRLEECCLAFCRAHYRFWRRNARILHMRNTFSETTPQIFEERNRSARGMLELLELQMGGGGSKPGTSALHMATVVLTGLERVATVVTTPYFRVVAADEDGASEEESADRLIRAEARLVEMAIRDQREAANLAEQAS